MMVAKQKNEMRMKVEAINKNTTALIGTTQEEVSVSQKLSDLIVRNNGIDYATEFQNKVINNPALVKLNDTVNATAFRIKELRDQKARAYKDIIKQYPGITHGAAILLANQQNDAVDQELNQLQNQQSVDTSNLQYQTGLLEKGFGLEYDQTRTQTSQAFEILKTVQGQQFQSSETQAGRDFQTSQFELQQSYANPDINSQDPNIARIAANKAIDQELKFARDNGIPVIRGQSQIIADAQAYAKKNGVSLSQAIQDTFTVPFQSKTEYKQALSNTQASKAPKDADKYEYRTEEDAAGNKGTAVYKDGVKISGA